MSFRRRSVRTSTTQNRALIRAKFGEASLATEGDKAGIYFYEADLTGAKFGMGSLTTEGENSNINFKGADLTRTEYGDATILAQNGEEMFDDLR